MTIYGDFSSLYFPYSVQIKENTDQKYSVFWHFLRNDNAIMPMRFLYA